jgi:hypothetical protein
MMESQGGKQAHECQRITLRCDEKITILALAIVRKAIDTPPEPLDQALARQPGKLGSAPPSRL